MKTSLTLINKAHIELIHKNPALLYGVTVLIGIERQACLLTLFTLYLLLLRRWWLLPLLASSIAFGSFFHTSISLPQNGYFSISQIKPHSSPFKKMLIYKGTLHSKEGSVPCSVVQPFNKNHTPANCDYLVQGDSKKTESNTLFFKPKTWEKVPHTWSFAEARFQAKNAFRKLLQKNFSPSSKELLSSIATGDVESRELRYRFNKLGLGHLLAISGFHFAILIFFCSRLLSFFVSNKTQWILLLFLINFYFLFVGPVPSVRRSFLVAILYLAAKFLGKNPSAPNILGGALLVECLIDPLAIHSLGFQLSYASSLGLLLFFQPIYRFLNSKLTKLKDPSLMQQHIRICSLFLIQSVSISAAVNLTIFPIILTHFHTFPLLSLYYNLFFPFLVSICLFLLLTSLLIYGIFPPLGSFFFKCTDFFTKEMLDLVQYPPISLDYSFRVYYFPSLLIPLLLFSFLCLSLLNEMVSWNKISRVYGGRSSVG